MEVQSIGSRNDNLGRILVDPLPEIFHNRGIAGGARIGRGMTKLSWFMPMLLAFCLPVRQVEMMMEWKAENHNGR
jgi:hypothetical protein